jgi:hypothetical protein
MRVVIKQKVARGQSVDRGTHVVPERGSIHLIRSAHSIKIGHAAKVVKATLHVRVATIKVIILPN